MSSEHEDSPISEIIEAATSPMDEGSVCIYFIRQYTVSTMNVVSIWDMQDAINHDMQLTKLECDETFHLKHGNK